MTWKAFSDRLAPDVTATINRFPFAILLLAALTAAALGAINELVSLSSEFWARLTVGLGTGAVLAAAGVLYCEDRPDRPKLGLVLAWIVPVLTVLAFLRDWSEIFVPYALPLVAVLWLSLAASTRSGHAVDRHVRQSQFWWRNNLAVATAAFALLTFLVLALGTVAIERSLGVLFGLNVEALFYRWILPVTGFFFVPIYWLAMQPRTLMDPGAEPAPDLLQRASGFIGPFILVPVLLAYAAILLAYCVQIVVTRSLPQGMLGWMVMGFTVTGAATWLILFPSFLDQQPIVRFFRRFWWWLTIVPLGLFAVALWQRIDAYGLTPERVALIWGGVWAASLTLIHLLGRGDIRLIPALAGLMLLLASIGPWNLEAWPRSDQAGRLEAALAASPMTPEAADQARGAMDFLAYEGEKGRAVLTAIAAARGADFDPAQGTYVLRRALGIPERTDAEAERQFWTRDRAASVDVAAAPNYIGSFSAYGSPVNAPPGLTFSVRGPTLTVAAGGGSGGIGVAVDIAAWLARQTGGRLSDPVVDFALGGRTYRLVVDDISFEPAPDATLAVHAMSGTLFSDQPNTVSATPRDPAAPGS